ncbi:prepilin-type N-terminal cleavage/methylation domain-containing protein [Ruficoccus amylovorans]|uniref:Prepilin-type N-terminal cleavage/methylation domain-containing protein n=1 Tax=Ruficoccus amylovorans TaxID=1804625 RepID=A0A842HKF2_9BACT|nr:prepilin-type N-terminal cleavage/methylation domain-containing protein [Ruficoccus amylovorans]MBC2596154.1 prepilin-type N-terminal cleavage/methylation domain-containing protein [Ruficoccus amylovorans]
MFSKATPSFPRRAGFTLAEVVVATVLLGLAATVLGRTVSDAMRAYSMTRLSNPYSYALRHVRQEIMEIPSREQLEEGGTIEVYVPNPGGSDKSETTIAVSARWEAEIYPTRLLNVYVVELDISFEAEGEAESFQRRITAYRPNWADAEENSTLLQAKEKEFELRLAARGITESEDDS